MNLKGFYRRKFIMLLTEEPIIKLINTDINAEYAAIYIRQSLRTELIDDTMFLIRMVSKFNAIIKGF